MQPNPVRAYRLEDGERADDVGVQERLRFGQRVVDVRLGGEVHDGVGLGDQLVDQLGVGDVALHQSDLVLDRHQRLTAARVGQRIENGQLILGVSRTHSWTKLAPMNPAPPVTSNRMVKP